MNYGLVQMALACIAFAAFGVSHLPGASFTVSPTDDATTLAQAILGTGVTIVGTPTLSSQTGQSGVFSNFNSGPYTQTGGASGQYSLLSGAILTTGLASAAIDPFIGGANVDVFGSGDAQLSALSGTSTFDADVLTIQFTTANPALLLNYAFASAEYPGFVGSKFADAFGIFVNGMNVALVPGTMTPISINSVNANVNSGFFTQYSNPNTPFNYGGLTTVLTARANVSTTSINTIRLGIADSLDGNLDSAVLIRGGSLASVPEPASVLLFATGFVLFGALAARRAVRR